MCPARFRAMRALLWSGSTRKTPHCGVLLTQNDTVGGGLLAGGSTVTKRSKKAPRGVLFEVVKETKSRHRRVWNPPVAVWNQSEAMNGIKPTNMQPREGARGTAVMLCQLRRLSRSRNFASRGGRGRARGRCRDLLRRVRAPRPRRQPPAEAGGGCGIYAREGLMPYHSRCEWIPFRRAATDAIPSLLRRLGYKKRVALFMPATKGSREAEISRD